MSSVIAELVTRFDADEAAIAERMLREYGGTVADKQLTNEVALSLATHRRNA